MPLKEITLSESELFCGAGESALGVHLAKYKGYCFKHIWATDYNKSACETFEKNFQTQKLYAGILKHLILRKCQKPAG